jgi:hypothetical protein
LLLQLNNTLLQSTRCSTLTTPSLHPIKNTISLSMQVGYLQKMCI